jgi:hypothetical protein
MMNDDGLLECPFCGSNEAYKDNGEERMLHGAILAEIRKTMPVGKFMDAVNRAKVNCGMLNKNSPQ